MVGFLLLVGNSHAGPPLDNSVIRALETQAVKALEKYKPRILRDKNQPGIPVVRVSLRGPKVEDSALKEIVFFPRFQSLELRRTGVQDAGLKALASLKHLQNLDLSETKITDSDLHHLASLKELQELSLGWTAVNSRWWFSTRQR
jgi:Leucine-rich repeat (LRR) protein